MATQGEPLREIKTSCSEDCYERHRFHLPDCLLLEILCRLPAKSAFRLKCVSKHWHALISDPSFVRFCRLRFKDSLPWTLYFRFVDFNGFWDVPKEHFGVHYVTSNHAAFKFPSFPGVPFSDQQEKLHCVASSGDLLLFIGYKRGRQPKALYYVCNPFISQWIQLPPPPPPHRAGWGLGFISRVENGIAHYKVVRITDFSYKGPPLPEYYRVKNIFHLDIFSSETGQWRNLEASLTQPMRVKIPFWPAISCNGFLHWIEDCVEKMIAYDPINEADRCRIINMPTDGENHRKSGLNAALGVCRGRLCYFEAADIFLEPGRLGSWSVWVLKDYDKGEWSLEHTARAREICSFDACPAAIHSSRRALTPVAFHPFNLDIMYFWCPGYILSFNLRTGWFEAEFYTIPAVNSAFILSSVVFPIVFPPWPNPAPTPCWKTAADGKENKGKLGRNLKRSFACICKEK